MHISYIFIIFTNFILRNKLNHMHTLYLQTLFILYSYFQTYILFILCFYRRQFNLYLFSHWYPCYFVIFTVFWYIFIGLNRFETITINTEIELKIAQFLCRFSLVYSEPCSELIISKSWTKTSLKLEKYEWKWQLLWSLKCCEIYVAFSDTGYG